MAHLMRLGERRPRGVGKGSVSQKRSRQRASQKRSAGPGEEAADARGGASKIPPSFSSKFGVGSCGRRKSGMLSTVCRGGFLLVFGGGCRGQRVSVPLEKESAKEVGGGRRWSRPFMTPSCRGLFRWGWARQLVWRRLRFVRSLALSGRGCLGGGGTGVR